MKILVTGARGFIGRHLVPALRSRGHEVLCLSRGEGSAPLDLAAIGEWPDWPEGVEGVAHLAALNPGRAARAGRNAAALHHANAAGTRALAERAAREGVRRFVLVSTANVHRPGGAAPIREDDAPQPQDAYAASKLAAEAALRAVAAAFPMEACVLRPPPVYGPGGRGAIASLARLAPLPLPLPLRGGGGRRSVVSVDACVEAVALALTHPAAAGETFLLADPHPLSPGDMVAALRRGLGRRPMLLPFPAAPLRALAALGGRSAAFDRLLGSFVVSGARMEERLGWRPPLTTEEGLARFMRETGGR